MTCHVYIGILKTSTEVVRMPKLSWCSFNTNGNDHIIIMAVLIKKTISSRFQKILFSCWISIWSDSIGTDIYKQQKSTFIMGVPGLVSFLTNSFGVGVVIRLLFSFWMNKNWKRIRNNEVAKGKITKRSWTTGYSIKVVPLDDDLKLTLRLNIFKMSEIVMHRNQNNLWLRRKKYWLKLW